MSQRSLRSAVRKPTTPATVDTSSDSSDDEDARRSNLASRGNKSFRGRGRGKGKSKNRKAKLIDFDPPPTPGSHPSEEDDDFEATPMFMSPYLDEDGPPPTPGYSGGFDTVRLGASVPSLVSNSLSALMANTGLNMDQPPPTPSPVGKDDGRHTPPITGMVPPPTPRMLSQTSVSGESSSSHPMPSTSYSSMSIHPGTKSKSSKSGKLAKPNYRAGVTHSMEEMVQNSILYFLLMQHRKVPVKRADIVKHAMNGQSKDFKSMMENLTAVFQEIFGISLVVLENPKGGKTVQPLNYGLVSKYSMTLSDSVTYRPSEVHYKRTILFLILSCIFMMNRSLEEDTVWKIMSNLNLHKEVGVKKIEDLRRYLRSEYVSPMYLALEESKDSEVSIARYSWGARSEKEFSKYGILKFVTKQFPGMKPSDFAVQYGLASIKEKAAVDKDIADAAARAARGEADTTPDNIIQEDEAPIDDDEDNDFLGTIDPEQGFGSHRPPSDHLMTVDEEEELNGLRRSRRGQQISDDSDESEESDEECDDDDDDDQPQSRGKVAGRKRRAIVDLDDDESEPNTPTNDDDASSNFASAGSEDDLEERMRFDDNPPSPTL